MRGLLIVCLILASCLAAAGAARAGPAGPAGPARVIDGDTLRVGGVTVRLSGIDAPERGQTCDRGSQAWDCGAFAARRLADLIGGAPVSCAAAPGADRYGRVLAACRTARGEDLGAAMVVSGAATAYRRYSDAYLAEEAAARAVRAGLWAGRMVTPEAARHAAGPVGPAGGCRIKGNVNDRGARTYHRPGQRHYDATRISRPGEAWFCTEAEARAAGFRPARS
jgi:endonuclease YncB( thermonuclease family)